jgi:esterase
MKLAFREFGSGAPLVILHGLFGQSDNWNTLAKSFSEQGFKVFTVDLRNHGLSPHSEEWSYPIMAEDLKAFIEEHGLEQPVLLGHSMGGKVLLFLEYLYPGSAYKLIVADIAARFYPPHHQKVIKALHAVNFDEITSRKEAEAVLLNYLDDFGTRQFLLKNIYWKASDRMDWRFNLKVISHQIENIGLEVPPFNSNTPALVMRGENSEYINENDIADFKNRFSTLQLVSIANAGHWLHAEKPKEFFEAVLKFIKA